MLNYNDHEYDYEQPQKKRKTKKKKNNVAKLLFIFISTFFGVLIIFLLLAKVLTPTIDIPEVASRDESISQTDEDNSFRKRIDSSLVDIFNDERFPKSVVNSETKKQEENNSDEENLTDKKEIDTNQSLTQHQNPFEDDFFKENSTQQEENITNNTNNQRVTAPVPPVPIPTPNQIEPAKPQKIISPTYKVLVGSFTTPEEARLFAKEMTSDGYSVTPFIRLINGKYAVQAGSFNDIERARTTANTLNHYYDGVKIIEEF